MMTKQEEIRERGRSRYPNMPRYQPCPLCNKSCGGRNKTLGGADYVFPLHGKFFVKKGGKIW